MRKLPFDEQVERAIRHSRSTTGVLTLKGDEPGLVLVVRGGVAEWQLRVRRLNGGRISKRLGFWPDLSPEAAAECARAAKVAFADAKGRPLKVRTVGSLLERYFEDRVSKLRSAAPTRRSLNLVLRGVGERDIRLLTSADLQSALAAVASTSPTHANRCLAYVRAFLNWAVRHQFLGSNPANGLASFRAARTAQKGRLLTLDEIGEVLLAAEAMPYPFGHAIELLVLIPWRREIISTVRRDDLDVSPDAVIWRRPALRPYRPKSRPTPKSLGYTTSQAYSEFEPVEWRLASSATWIIRDALRRSPEGSSFVFDGGAESPISGWSKAKKRLDGHIASHRASRGLPQLEPWLLDDLRRSFEAIAIAHIRTDEWTINRCLNRSDRFRNPIGREWVRGQEVVEMSARLLVSWADLVYSAADRIRLCTGVEAQASDTHPKGRDCN